MSVCEPYRPNINCLSINDFGSIVKKRGRKRPSIEKRDGNINNYFTGCNKENFEPQIKYQTLNRSDHNISFGPKASTKVSIQNIIEFRSRIRNNLIYFPQNYKHPQKSTQNKENRAKPFCLQGKGQRFSEYQETVDWIKKLLSNQNNRDLNNQPTIVRNYGTSITQSSDQPPLRNLTKLNQYY